MYSYIIISKNKKLLARTIVVLKSLEYQHLGYALIRYWYAPIKNKIGEIGLLARTAARRRRTAQLPHHERRNGCYHYQRKNARGAGPLVPSIPTRCCCCCALHHSDPQTLSSSCQLLIIRVPNAFEHTQPHRTPLQSTRPPSQQTIPALRASTDTFAIKQQ